MMTMVTVAFQSLKQKKRSTALIKLQVMVAATKMILLDPPCFRKWLNKMTNIIQNKFLDIWGPFIDHLEEK